MCSVDVMENHHNSNQQCQQLSLQLNSKRWVQNSTGWSIPFNIVHLVEVLHWNIGLQIFQFLQSRFPFLCPFHGLYNGIEAYDAGL